MRYGTEINENTFDDDDLKAKLKDKITCLLKQTDPSKKNVDYKTDCSLPLYINILENSAVEDDSSPDISSGIVDTEMPTEPPSMSPSISSTTLPGSNETLSVNIPVTNITPEHSVYGTNGSYPGAFPGTGEPDRMTKPNASVEDGVAPFIRTPASPSSKPLTLPTYAIIAVTFILFVVPCILYWLCREHCRAMVLREKAKRYKTSLDGWGTDSSDETIDEIEDQLIQAAVTTKDARAVDLEVGSAIIEKTLFRSNKNNISLYARTLHPSLWQKLVDEARRHASLRAKWNVYTVSGVVLGSGCDSTEEIAQTCPTIEERPPHTLVESSDESRNRDQETIQNAVLEDVQHLDDTTISNLTEEDGNSSTEDGGKNEDVSSAEVSSSPDLTHDIKNEEINCSGEEDENPISDEETKMKNEEINYSSEEDENSILDEETKIEEVPDSDQVSNDGTQTTACGNGADKEVSNEDCNEEAKAKNVLGNGELV